MNKLSVFALSMFVVGAAMAESPMPEDQFAQNGAQPKTRAEVRAELEQAKRDGSIRVLSSSYNPLALAKSFKSRDDVRAELFAARRDGSAEMLGEDSGSFALAHPKRDPLAVTPILAGTPRSGQ